MEDLCVLGLNHKTAAVAVREKVAVSPENLPSFLQGLVGLPYVQECMLVSTCNRTEILASLSHDDGRDQLLAFWAEHSRIDRAELDNVVYVHRGDAALVHCMRVASGLDSMVLGEPQILGQVKSAWLVARDAGVLGACLMKVMDAVFSCAKRIRTETAIGRNPVSVAFAAVALAERIFESLASTRVLLIGAGETIDLVARHLHERQVRQMVVINRTQQRADELAARFSARSMLFSDLPEALCDADIVISSTASQLPILGKGMVESSLRKSRRRHRPVFMLDLAVPRDIEPEVGQLDDLYLYSVDDLTQVVESNRQQRAREIGMADGIVDEERQAFRARCRMQQGIDLVKLYRNHVEALRDRAEEQALDALSKGEDPEVVIRQLARGLSNRIMHIPTRRLKDFSAQGASEHIRSFRELMLPEDQLRVLMERGDLS
jgi:glutamyl-tRNA reductase